MHHLHKLPDWPGVLAAVNGLILTVIKFGLACLALLLPSMAEMEAILAHVPTWTSAITGVLGVVFLCVKRWQQMREWRDKRKGRRRSAERR